MPSRRSRLIVPTTALLTSTVVLVGIAASRDDASYGAVTPTPELEGPTWLLDVAQLGIAGTGGVVATIRFLEGQVTGGTGCNSFFGTYTLDGHRLALSPLGSTLIACAPPRDEVERQVLDRLAKVTGYKLDDDRLTLRAGDRPVLRYRRNQPVITGDWSATGVLVGNGFSSIVGGVDLTAEFAADGELSGFGGCNRFRGDYTVTGGNLAIGPLVATLVACSEELMTQERAYFAALESAATWDQVGDELTISNPEGQQAVSFQRRAA